MFKKNLSKKFKPLRYHNKVLNFTTETKHKKLWKSLKNIDFYDNLSKIEMINIEIKLIIQPEGPAH